MPLQWCNQSWQSLEEGGGKWCWECGSDDQPATTDVTDMLPVIITDMLPVMGRIIIIMDISCPAQIVCSTNILLAPFTQAYRLPPQSSSACNTIFSSAIFFLSFCCCCFLFSVEKNLHYAKIVCMRVCSSISVPFLCNF